MNWYIAFMKCISSRWKCSFKRAALKTFPIFSGKHLRWSLFFVKLQDRHATLLKKESNTSGFLRILRNFQEQLFYRASTSWDHCQGFFSLQTSDMLKTQKMTFSIKVFCGKCEQIHRKSTDLVTFTEEFLDGKFHFCEMY